MENMVFVGATRVTMSGDRGSQLPHDWQLARSGRLNLLLIDSEGAAEDVLDSLLLDVDEPVATWRPGERLVLPPEPGEETIVLHDVGALTPDDQIRLLDWLETAAGRTQIVSTTTAPLLPRVHAGAFIDTLYYRLNTVCVDVTA
jgi:transcriptional regulator of acetoin/glycerol metabolism